MEKMKLNDQIAFLRRQEGITQEDLAKTLGITNQAVSKWESGQCCPDIQLLPELADYFGVSIDELMGHETTNSVTKRVKETTFTGDSKLEYAIAIAKEAGKISVSFLQRELRLGYFQSVNLINRMESLGYIIKADNCFSYVGEST